jgi:hypothetical protein
MKVVLFAAVMSLSLLASCSSQATSSHATIKMSPTIKETLSQAQNQLPFQIQMPTANHLELVNVLVHKNPNNGIPDSVQMQFVMKDKVGFLDVEERSGNGLGHLGLNFANSETYPEKDVMVRHMKARYQKGEKLSGLIWSDGKVQYILFVPSASDLAGEAALIGIAESFQ